MYNLILCLIITNIKMNAALMSIITNTSMSIITNTACTVNCGR